jgi:hypothetical protein
MVSQNAESSKMPMRSFSTRVKGESSPTKVRKIRLQNITNLRHSNKEELRIKRKKPKSL